MINSLSTLNSFYKFWCNFVLWSRLVAELLAFLEVSSCRTWWNPSTFTCQSSLWTGRTRILWGDVSYEPTVVPKMVVTAFRRAKAWGVRPLGTSNRMAQRRRTVGGHQNQMNEKKVLEPLGKQGARGLKRFENHGLKKEPWEPLAYTNIYF